MRFKPEIVNIRKEFNVTFNGVVNLAQEHPKQTLIVVCFAVIGLLSSNVHERNERNKEQNRHEEVELLQMAEIKKQDAMIQSLKSSVEENMYLKQIIMMLCDSSAG